ncbi:galactosyl transferase [Paramyrothecium foliicola]|nr:galactosyl transferase [Paramyrothecium foliicola]
MQHADAMIFGNQLRSSKMTALFVGAVVFMAIFIGLVYNHMDSFQEVPSNVQKPPTAIVDDSNTITPPEKQPPANSVPEHIPEPKKPEEPTKPEEPAKPEAPAKPEEPAKPEDNAEEDDEPARPPPTTNDPTTTPDVPMSDLVKFYFDKMITPFTKVDSRKYKAWGAVDFDIKEEMPIRWKELQREKICIIDLDNRPFNETGQIWGKEKMSWSDPEKVHGLSLGLLNHWVYAKIHGYKYYYINIDAYPDRRNSWKKPPVMTKILKEHEACLYLDSDAIFNHLDLPFEWLMNYWGLHPSNNSLALAFDPDAPNNKDQFGKVYLNTGFIVAQNNKKTFEILDAWQNCPEENGKHPDCVIFRTNGPGRPTDQGGFGTYTRYDYPDDITNLPCTEANGFPESHSGCEGKFIRHLWTGKSSWIKATVGAQMPGPYLEELHQRFLDEKPFYYMTEKELMARP